jgi:hypothetical protein
MARQVRSREITNDISSLTGGGGKEARLSRIPARLSRAMALLSRIGREMSDQPRIFVLRA